MVRERWRFARWGATAESLVLLAVGLFMITLASGESYWALLNPRFQWLTLGAGYLIAALGVAATFVPGRRAEPWRLGCFALFVALLLFLDHSVLRPAALPAGGDPEAFGPARIEHEGREYVRINVGELYLLAEDGATEAQARHFVVRALARKTPELEALGQFAVVRTAVSCCLADAVAFGLRVEGIDPKLVTDGQWLQLFGRLEKPSQPLEQLRPPRVRGVFFTALSDSYLFVVDHFQPIAAPAVPIMFELRYDEPYAY